MRSLDVSCWIASAKPCSAPIAGRIMSRCRPSAAHGVRRLRDRGRGRPAELEGAPPRETLTGALRTGVTRNSVVVTTSSGSSGCSNRLAMHLAARCKALRIACIVCKAPSYDSGFRAIGATDGRPFPTRTRIPSLMPKSKSIGVSVREASPGGNVGRRCGCGNQRWWRARKKELLS